MKLLPLQILEESNDTESATCWLPIFKRGIIAYGFPIPDRHGEKGIELPFSLMTDQAGVLYPVKYKGKVYLRGFSCILFPTSASKKSRAVQWHLIHSGDSAKRLPHDTLPIDSNAQWLKTSNLKNLSTAPRTFLGYCKHVEVHLCNEQGSIDLIQVSGASTEEHRPGLLWKSIMAGIFGKGFVNLTLSAEIIRPRRLTDEAKKRRLRPMLDEAKYTPVILYDLASDRARLVPTVSVILLMIRINARDDQELLAKLPAAIPSWDAAAEAMKVIEEKEKLELPREIGESDQRSLSDLVRDLLVAIDSKIVKSRIAKHEHATSVRTESKKIYGWELLDIAKERNVVRKQLRCSEGWITLADEFLVLFGQNFGEIIRPAPDTKICATWNPLPPNKQYLTATIKSLQDWSCAKWGSPSNGSDCLKIRDKAYWQPEASLFADCHDGDAIARLQSCRCSKAPQHLRESAQKSRKTSLPTEGAVVFGTRKLQKTRLNGSQQNGYAIPSASGHAVGNIDRGRGSDEMH